jgi:intracellular sulfur oxidation DsrE/DsrF family protein
MRFPIFLLALTAAAFSLCASQTTEGATPGDAARDSLARTKASEDSVKMAKLFARLQFPYIKGGKWSGVIPVENPTEIPDPSRQYKLLFELTAKNPDSLANEINASLDEVARILNLHVASGIPGKNLIPVVVIHGPGLEALWTNDAYRKKHTMDNPNLQLVNDLKAVGTKFIVCGQAMAFFGTEKEFLLPDVNISLTAQTVLSTYQLQGYVVFRIEPDR